MNGRAYYNEIDAFAAAWLRNLIADGLIAPGDVDERDIRDVRPGDLDGYTQCHFFASIGVWSYALRLAGWPDDRPVWTGSCPCQPFSAAGKQKAEKDDRHLWPEFHRLIAERNPSTVFGEQVASRLGREWLAVVRLQMEALGYAVGAADLCAAGVGAPHIRQRLWFVAHAYGGHSGAKREQRGGQHGREPQGRRTESVADSAQRGKQGRGVQGQCESRGSVHGQAPQQRFERRGTSSGMGDANGEGPPARRKTAFQGRAGAAVVTGSGNDGPWTDPEWLPCTDGKQRPTKPGLFPLVDGTAFRVDAGGPFAGKSRVKMLRGSGNAIVPQVAAAFIEAAM